MMLYCYIIFRLARKVLPKMFYLKGGVFANGFQFEGDDRNKFFEWDMKEAIEMAAKKEVWSYTADSMYT